MQAWSTVTSLGRRDTRPARPSGRPRIHIHCRARSEQQARNTAARHSASETTLRDHEAVHGEVERFAHPRLPELAGDRTTTETTSCCWVSCAVTELLNSKQQNGWTKTVAVPISLVQATRSVAARIISSHAAFASNR
jgi:hypothetical protein